MKRAKRVVVMALHVKNSVKIMAKAKKGFCSPIFFKFSFFSYGKKRNHGSSYQKPSSRKYDEGYGSENSGEQQAYGGDYGGRKEQRGYEREGGK